MNQALQAQQIIPEEILKRLSPTEVGEEQQPVETEELEATAAAAIGVSGVYQRLGFAREVLRLDVDGRYPQRVASGTILLGLTGRIDWIAPVRRLSANRWSGTINYKEGNTSNFPYTQVEIQTALGLLTVRFRGGGQQVVRQYIYRSPYFRQVEFEFDCAEGISALKSIKTHDHPNRPASLPSEVLSIETVYARSGFAVRSSGGDSIVPLAGAGPNQLWNDGEMHDAMQTYWSRFAPRAQWSLWTFFAAQHEMGHSLGGIMFDDIGPNHRQGTALFLKSFISDPPAGDPQPDAWVRRMVFWTAVHEMGHAFNLAHSWNKDDGVPWRTIPDELEARSFMNYPFAVSGGQTAFFRDFEFRFSDAELLFLRHAPEPYVQMGNAAWFDHHGFQQADAPAESTFELVVRANREPCVFEFLEPVVLELKLTNVTDEPQLVPEHLLLDSERMTVVIKKNGREARQLIPFARHCRRDRNTVLEQGDSKYQSLFASVGRNGWDIAEPGYYLIQVALRVGDRDVVSNPLVLKVAPPANRTEENLALDYFVEDVGRVLTFDGSQRLDQANDTLRQIRDALPDRKVASHAEVALTLPQIRKYKLLEIPSSHMSACSAAAAGARIQTHSIDEAALDRLAEKLGAPQDASSAAETLGHVDYRDYMDLATTAYAELDDDKRAVEVQETLRQTLAQRNVLDRVLEEIEERKNALAKTDGNSRRRGGARRRQ